MILNRVSNGIYLRYRQQSRLSFYAASLSRARYSSTLQRNANTADPQPNHVAVQNHIVELKSQPLEKIDVHQLLSFDKIDTEEYRTTNAQYLQRTLPMRMAHRVHDFQLLPFIVGCNPAIKSVYELQVHNFDLLRRFPEITTIGEEKEFLHMITDLLNQNSDVVNTLARGFGQCKHHMPKDQLTRVSDRR
ncbi:hypothetical protein SARC_10679 [Sphaeroforma arctica JP610]|uniref:Protein-serine/threonine kinase n=1 Tax=Sphaeroforma arctica JP610 TaxID=667725 RepID=A0A0L0FLD7_9EUKA|nr:hypothetical protein SARC_10679 [Sphaeroforma arctica JP610]KNC76843.1 hypothetical protein SARC_10679 [Sphaeroforma arctica JP610]|eukprot:XP_014150745.1 hypothetical protein SARC_10679 [Sphaeroforma arctica JP610]